VACKKGETYHIVHLSVPIIPTQHYHTVAMDTVMQLTHTVVQVCEIPTDLEEVTSLIGCSNGVNEGGTGSKLGKCDVFSASPNEHFNLICPCQ
jgi:hypothetical protein